MEIVKCTEEDGVEYKTDEEIKEYFALQQIFILSNQLSFDFQKYGEDAIVMESNLHQIWLGNWQSYQLLSVSKTELSLQDLAIDLDELTELQDSSVFRLKEGN